MKKLKLKRWVKVTIVIILITATWTALKKLDDHFMKNCIESGYSENYCKGER